MNYNSQRDSLKMPEYGRHIQKMVQQAVEIEDKAERTRYTGHIIKVMGDLFPYLRDVAEFKQKLYDHLAIMSDFQLDIDSDFKLPTKEALEVVVEPMNYPQKNIKLRYYGGKIEEMIKSCCNIENEEARMRMANAIANHMKHSYITWNKKVLVDNKIYQDLSLLSNGVLDYSEADFKLCDPENHHRQGQVQTAQKNQSPKNQSPKNQTKNQSQNPNKKRKK